MLNDSPADGILLFQYGSNMSGERLRTKIRKHQSCAPDGAELEVRLIDCARLLGWRFVLDLYSAQQACLVGDIIEGQEGDEVWGALYELDPELVIRSDGERAVLDRIEGHRTEVDPPNYTPITVTVELNGEPRHARTYVGREDARQRCRSDHPEAVPRPDYLSAILDGARCVGLPAEYVTTLAETIQGSPRARRP